MYTVVKNSGCGSCLFYAIAQGIIHKKKLTDNYIALGRELRKIAVNTISDKTQKNNVYKMIVSTTYADEVLQQSNTNRDYSKRYVKWMSSDKAWGGDIEIKALSKYLHSIGIAGIRIYYANTEMNGQIQRTIVPIIGLGTRVKKSKTYPVIKIILHDANNLGSHYEYIYKTSNINNNKYKTSNINNNKYKTSNINNNKNKPQRASVPF
jgi:hypothetical protein